MDLHARTITAPDGTVWDVSPLWKGRRHGPRVPSAWRQLRERRRAQRAAGREPEKSKGSNDMSGLDACDCDCGDTVDSAILVVVVLVVVGGLAYFVVWPLLALAIELLIVLFLIFAAFVGRAAFGHPWIVEADASDGRRLEYRVAGYGAMRRVIREVSEGLAFGVAEPVPSGAERVVVAPAAS